MLPERVVIVRALPGLGDFLCAVPALRALRSSLPRARVALVGLPPARRYAERFPRYLDEFLEFPGFPGIAEREPDQERLRAFLADVRERRFDLAVQLHGSGGASNPFTLLLGARRTAGFHLPDQPLPGGGEFFPFPAGEPEVRRWLRLLEHLGIPSRGEDLEFPAREADGRELAEAAPGLLPRRYACLHPGAGRPEKRWPPERFAAVGDHLAGRGLQVVLSGTAEEAPVTRAVAAAMRSRPLDLAGRLGLGAAAALLRGAHLLVGNDTGVAHLAAAVRTPSVIVFLAADRERWAPLDRALHRAVGEPVGYGERSPGPPVAAEVSVGEVLAEVEDLLTGEGARVA